MAVNIAFSSLGSYLGDVSENTVDTPLEINIIDTTLDDWIASINEGTVGYVIAHSKRYVDLSSTTLPEDLEEMDSTFENCKYLVKAPAIPENINNLSECFRGCSNLKSAPTIPENVGSMFGTFQDCTSLTTAPTIPDTVSSLAYCFSGCTKLTSVSSIPDSVINMSYCFRNCTSLINAPTLGNAILQMNGCFQGCTSLVTGPEIPQSVNNMTNCYSGCTGLTTINNFPNNITKTTKNTYKNCTSLYNGGVFRNISKVSELFNGAAIQACGMLVDSVTSTTFGDIKNLKIYTTKDHYDSLKESIETNYSDRNFSVIQVDACLDYDEISDWLSSQEENTEDTPYVIFVGGGLTSDRLNYEDRFQDTSDFARLFSEEKYVDLINLYLSKDTTKLQRSFCRYGTLQMGGSYKYPKIVRICEIPPQVKKLYQTFIDNTIIKGFGENNLIPETVIECNSPFSNTTNLKDVYIEHNITNHLYVFGKDSATYNIYAKDYSNLYITSKDMCDARRIILECDYTDLDTYLNWFETSCEDVNLKCNNLTTENLAGTGTSSPLSGCEFSKKLLGTNIEDSIIKGYCAASTFDLRLTELPAGLTTLAGSFLNGNISYSPTILDTITSLNNTFNSCDLKEMPDIPESVIDMSGAFCYCDLTEAKKIPESVIKLDHTFYNCKNLKTIINIPSKVTDLTKTFCTTIITETPEIPDSVTIMDNTFTACKSLTKVVNLPKDLEYAPAMFRACSSLLDIPNIPSTVTNFQEAFAGCIELKTIHNWDLDVTKDDLVMTDCFNGCSNLTKIYTISAPATTEYPSSDLDSGWRHITIKPTSYDTYKITCRDLKGNTTKLEITSTDIQTFYTDEILFSPNGTLDDSYIEDMLSYKLAFGDGLDPSKKNFVVWAKDATAVKTNIVGNISNNVTELQETIDELKNELGKSIKVVGRLADDTTSLTIENENIKEDMMVSVFTSIFGISPSSVNVVDGSVTVNFDEPHNEMTVGVKLEYFDVTVIDYAIKYINTVANTALTTIEPKTFKITDNITLPTPNLTRTGYTLKGWTEDTSTNKLITGWSAGAKKDTVTLYTVWGANSYKIILNSNNGNNETVEVDATFDENVTLPANTFTSTDENALNFVGWGLASDSEEVAYENSATVSNLTSINNDTFNLYAIWKEGSITYHTNGGTFEE